MFEMIRPALIVTKREIRDQFRDWRVIFPIIGLTIFFPFLMNFTARQILAFVEDYGATIVGERMVPFLLMVVGFFPISVSLVIALETFVGEKERGSIEPLLNTPLADWQLYLGKLLSSTFPPLVSSYLGMTVYLIGLIQKDIPLPETGILVQILVLTTVQAIMMVAGAVVVSSQATSVRAANLLASFIIIPAALLIQGESVVMFWGNNTSLWWAVVGLIGLTILLVRIGLAHFHREELLGREIDVLNIRWMGKQFIRQFVGGASGLASWYRITISNTLAKLKIPLFLTTGIVLVAFVIGILQINRFQVSLADISFEDVNNRLQTLLQNWQSVPMLPVFTIWWQNLRTLILAMLLGLVSLGILGPIPLIATVGIAGYLLSLLHSNGLPIFTYMLFILPHGIIEIPVAILATAAVIRMGAVLATPTTDKTVGEVMIITLADWAKVMLGFVVPLLFIAAMIEAWITPRLVLLLL